MIAYKIKHRSEAELNLRHLRSLSKLSFTGAVSALQFIKHSIDTLPFSTLTNVELDVGVYPCISLTRCMSLLDTFDGSLACRIEKEGLVGVLVTVRQHTRLVNENLQSHLVELAFSQVGELIRRRFCLGFDIW